ncbi:thioesterase II family protein [Marinactinospora thermotolerans]|uniref:Pyochelin biosynthetic protein PchC n=1 Tax=Marinactinospora thermotolerans DSM 45154 TaxID=1122192 RepID=A0A1T4NJH5_9ACTN|nr:alpha/beta fold hydrolase [Marinactinospora thermotolerans]SJZ79440.1 pyochelin biosynthetic protein PchC [Marinactinospora thermotolerans DSM 45154]
MTASSPHPWLRRFRPEPGARLRLVCLPHAGGGANAYRSWAALLPSAVDLVCAQYPGREDRLGEEPVDDMATLVAALADGLAPLLDRPYALFGHSMGSAVAYELARELRARGHAEPRRLFASGRMAPGDAPAGTVHLATDEEIVTELVRLGGTEREVLADPGMRAVVLGCVRADYRLIERYRPFPGAPLSCPVSVFTGNADPEVDAGRAAGWAGVTTGRMDVQVFPGDHFYLGPAREAVVRALLRRLDPALAAARQPWPSTP